jgi:hypothetical protein
VLVERGEEGTDEEVKLTVVAPKVPAAVGGGASEESPEPATPEEPAPPPPAADVEQS